MRRRTRPAAGGGKGAASALPLASNSSVSACGACSSLQPHLHPNSTKNGLDTPLSIPPISPLPPSPPSPPAQLPLRPSPPSIYHLRRLSACRPVQSIQSPSARFLQ